ncbi:MAG: hypothetical protein ACR2JO_12060 [Mycobacteriales bacterium]
MRRRLAASTARHLGVAGVLLGLTAVGLPGAGPAAAATVTTVQESAPAVQYNGWKSYADPAARGGTFRMSGTAGDTATFSFTNDGIGTLVRSGPDQGKVKISIDGVAKPAVSLWRRDQGPWSQLVYLCTWGHHTVVATVLGQKNDLSTGTNVTFDGFFVKPTNYTEDTSTKIAYNTWLGATSTSASGGSYRVSGRADAVITFPFTGTGVEFVSARGPAFGKVSVQIDAQPAVTVDLYAATTSWQSVAKSFSSLASGQHRITVKPLGVKNGASSGTSVVVDAFVVHS